MSTFGPLLKHLPTDLVVREAVAADLVDESEAVVEYLLLRKTGYTIFEAIRLPAALFLASGSYATSAVRQVLGYRTTPVGAR